MLIVVDLVWCDVILVMVECVVVEKGGIDIVVYNVGVFFIVLIEVIGEDVFDEMFVVNFKVVFWLVKVVVLYLWWVLLLCFLFILLVIGLCVVLLGLVYYVVFKLGFNGFICVVVMEYVCDCIIVNGVELGLILIDVMV